MPKKHMIIADYADVRTVGIPRALLYYRYGVFWAEFFTLLGPRCLRSCGFGGR